MRGLDKETRVQGALKDFKEKRYPSLRQVADAWSVEHTTVSRRTKGMVSRQKAQIHRQLLSPLEENQMYEWIMDIWQRNIPARVGMLNRLALNILKARELLLNHS